MFKKAFNLFIVCVIQHHNGADRVVVNQSQHVHGSFRGWGLYQNDSFLFEVGLDNNR